MHISVNFLLELCHGPNRESVDLSVIQEIANSDPGIDFQQIHERNWMIFRLENFAVYTIITPKV